MSSSVVNIGYDQRQGTLGIEFDVLRFVRDYFDVMVDERAEFGQLVECCTDDPAEQQACLDAGECAAQDGEQSYPEFLETSYFEQIAEIHRLSEENDRLAAALVDAQYELEAANEALSNALSLPREIVLQAHSLNVEVDRGYDEFGPTLFRRPPEVTVSAEIAPRDMGPSYDRLFEHLAETFGRRSAG